MIVFRSALVQIALFSFLMPAAMASHRHHHHQNAAPAAPAVVLDLTPVIVQPYAVPPPATVPDPAKASFLKRMNLENGVEVRSTRWIEPGDVSTRNLFILSVTQSLEGGFDSVNLYDKGVLSWGIMQWTAGTGSLPPSRQASPISPPPRIWATAKTTPRSSRLRRFDENDAGMEIP